MRTTLNLDEALLEKAHRLTGIEERTALIHEGIRALIARESARRLARLGGTEPRVKDIPRRRGAHTDGLAVDARSTIGKHRVGARRRGALPSARSHRIAVA